MTLCVVASALAEPPIPNEWTGSARLSAELPVGDIESFQAQALDQVAFGPAIADAPDIDELVFAAELDFRAAALRSAAFSVEGRLVNPAYAGLVDIDLTSIQVSEEASPPLASMASLGAEVWEAPLGLARAADRLAIWIE